MPLGQSWKSNLVSSPLTFLLGFSKLLKIFFLRFLSFSFLFVSFSGSSRPDVFCLKCVLRNFAKFTGKHLGQSFYFNKVAGLGPGVSFFTLSYDWGLYHTGTSAMKELILLPTTIEHATTLLKKDSEKGDSLWFY